MLEHFLQNNEFSFCSQGHNWQILLDQESCETFFMIFSWCLHPDYQKKPKTANINYRVR